MSDDLILSGAGSTTVASSELLERADRLALLTTRFSAGADDLLWSYRYDGTPSPAWGAGSPEVALLDAENWLRQAATLAGDLAGSLRSAAEGYGAAERAATAVARFAAAQSAYLLGFVLPFLVVGLLPLSGGAAAGAGLAFTARGRSERGRRRSGAGAAAGLTAAGATMVDPETARRMLRDPQVIALLGLLLSSADDAVAGISHFPHAFQLALGGEGLGYFGVGTSALMLTVVARKRLQETAVSVHRVGQSPTAAPASFVDLAARVPSAEAGSPQVTIERYIKDTGQPTWVVYVGGTIDATGQTGSEPWDMTSNVRAIARAQAGSVTATLRAMTAAGIAPSDPLILVGHSQGGLVATAVAASDRFGRGEHTGLLTFGSPTGQLPLPQTVHAIGIEHLDDPIPALGGVGLANNPRLLVRRQVFTDTQPATDDWLPAHTMDRYRETAALLDEVRDPRLDAFASLLGALNDSPDGTRNQWRAERLAER